MDQEEFDRIKYQLEESVTEFFELYEMLNHMQELYKKDRTGLEQKFGSFMAAREAGLPDREELSRLQLDNLISETEVTLSESFHERLLEKLKSVNFRDYTTEPKMDYKPITLEELLNITKDYFSEFSRDALTGLAEASVEPEDFITMVYVYYKAGNCHPLSEEDIIVLEYGKEKILDFVLSERETYYSGQGLYILPDFHDYLEIEGNTMKN